jgi:hypothetical protein
LTLSLPLIENIKNNNILATNLLIESLIKEVRLYDGVDTNKPIPATLHVNLELRIKSHMALALGICPPGHVTELMKDRLDAANESDRRLKRNS